VEALEHQLVEFLTNLFQSIGWFGVVVIMALESANIPIPSEVTMPLSGWMLVQARGLSALQALLLGGLWGGVGCTVGSIGSYWLGAWGGRPPRGGSGKGRPLVCSLGRLGSVHLSTAAHRAYLYLFSSRGGAHAFRALYHL